MESCGNCLHKKVAIYGPKYDTAKLSCKHGYKLNTLLHPAKDDCWAELPQNIREGKVKKA